MKKVKKDSLKHIGNLLNNSLNLTLGDVTQTAFLTCSSLNSTRLVGELKSFVFFAKETKVIFYIK
jgi:hypothetical protein